MEWPEGSLMGDFLSSQNGPNGGGTLVRDSV